ncbi:hypothetical protein BC567DRAFT_269586 [Phyllosticta citribraziliensis]
MAVSTSDQICDEFAQVTTRVRLPTVPESSAGLPLSLAAFISTRTRGSLRRPGKSMRPSAVLRSAFTPHAHSHQYTVLYVFSGADADALHAPGLRVRGGGNVVYIMYVDGHPLEDVGVQHLRHLCMKNFSSSEFLPPCLRADAMCRRKAGVRRSAIGATQSQSSQTKQKAKSAAIDEGQSTGYEVQGYRRLQRDQRAVDGRRRRRVATGEACRQGSTSSSFGLARRKSVGKAAKRLLM